MLNERSRSERIVSRCRFSGRVEHARRLLEPPALERVDHRVQHQADPGERLHRPVVEEEREPPPLLLLGDDQLVGQPRALGLALLRLGEQLRVLDRAAGEVGQQLRPRKLLAVERFRSHELQRADLLAADPQRQHDRSRKSARAGRQQRRLGAEQLPGLAPRLVEHLLGLVRRGDRAHRLDQRLEEARLRRELLLDDLVPAALGDDQVQREPGGADDRRAEAGEGRASWSSTRAPAATRSQRPSTAATSNAHRC